MTSRFEVFHRGTRLGECTLQIPGRHNVLNALAAIGVGLDLEIPFLTITKALAGFAGVQRRFQIRGTAGGVTVVDDYGHHPAEIRATLAAAKAGFDCRIVTVFQPHRYTRTQHLRQEFLTAFNQADVLVVMDIYAAGEAPIPGVTRRRPRRRHSRPRPPQRHLSRQRSGDASSITCARSAGRAISCSRWAPATSASWDRTFCVGSRPSAEWEGDMLGEIRGEVRFKEPLSFHTSLRIGGPADIFVVPQDIDDIRHALMFAEREQLPVAVVGGGNNLLVKDRGDSRRRPQARGLPRAGRVPRRGGGGRRRRQPLVAHPRGGRAQPGRARVRWSAFPPRSAAPWP